MKTKIFTSIKIFAMVFIIFASTGASVAQTKEHNPNQDLPEIYEETGIEDVLFSENQISNLRFYKNGDNVLLKFQNNTNSDLYVDVYDITGKMIISDVVKESNREVSKSYSPNSLKELIYVLKIHNGENVMTRSTYFTN